jgi:hypothetical protein
MYSPEICLFFYYCIKLQCLIHAFCLLPHQVKPSLSFQFMLIFAINPWRRNNSEGFTPQSTTYYLLPTTNYLLPTTYYLLLTTDYQLLTTDYLLPTTYYRLLLKLQTLQTPICLTEYTLNPTISSHQHLLNTDNSLQYFRDSYLHTQSVLNPFHHCLLPDSD